MIKRLARVSLLGAVALAGTLSFSGGVAAAPVQGQLVPGQYIVLTAAGVDPAQVAADHGLAARHTYRAALNGFAGAVPGHKLADLAGDTRVLAVEQERIYRLDVQEQPTGIDRIETDRNPNADIDQTDDVRVNLDVAIIDTGIALHSDLNVAGGANFSGGSTSNWNDGNGHGTHVAGTVGALDNGFGVVGVAPGVRVWAVKVCKNGGICMTGDMVAGINWVAQRKAEANDGASDGDAGINFASANMSISTSDDANSCTGGSGAVHEAICGVVSRGVVFALAAGNDGREKAAYPEALAVSALADFDGKGGGQGSPTCRSDEDDTLANFSNFGSTVDIAAPGVCILSTWNDGGYNTISGTSMATPHVAGAVALYIHANVSVSPATDAAGVEAIEQAILAAALPQGDPCGYTNERAGAGSSEPLLFVNATAFGGDGSCDADSGAGPTTDIAIAAVNAPGSVVQGDIVSVEVTVDNVGTEDVNSDINVTLSDETAAVDIGTQTISGGLVAGSSTTLTYSWDTSGASIGDHTLVASHDFMDDVASNDSASTTVTVSDTATDVTVIAIAPNTIQAGTPESVSITGTGFAAGASVTFENGTGPSPEASNVVVSADGIEITATVTAKSGGPPRNRVWDVRVTNPDGSSGVLSGALTVTP